MPISNPNMRVINLIAQGGTGGGGEVVTLYSELSIEVKSNKNEYDLKDKPVLFLKVIERQ